MTTSQPTPAYLSQIGHYNFLYPNFAQQVVLDEGTKLTRLPWSRQDNLTPFLVVTGVTTIVVWVNVDQCLILPE